VVVLWGLASDSWARRDVGNDSVVADVSVDALVVLDVSSVGLEVDGSTVLGGLGVDEGVATGIHAVLIGWDGVLALTSQSVDVSLLSVDIAVGT